METLISETGLLEEWHYCYSGGSLLNALDLPAIESVRDQKHRHSWEECVKDRLGEYLETLVNETELPEEWHYCYSGGAILSQ